LIGEGTATIVFLAQEAKLERLVALKVLNSSFAADAVIRARFQSDALAAASILHPNVAAIYRVGERADGLPYIAQEYICGRSLADLLHSSEVRTVSESTRIVASLAKAVAAAHAQRAVHCDVKPSNVLIQRDSGRVVLMNIGIGPEDVRGEPTTEANDVFRLGVLAYELLTGRGPYEGSVPLEPAHAQIFAEPLDLRSVRTDVPEALAQLLKRCLDKNSDERPTAKGLARQLARDEHTELTLDSMRLTQRAVESSLMRVAVISGLVIMAIGAAVGLWIFAHYGQ
jgi:serine/threonine-protein kinase